MMGPTPKREEGEMQFGVHLPQIGVAWPGAEIARFARAVEEMGFDAVWASDHIVFPLDVRSRYPYAESGDFPLPPAAPWLEAVTTLAFVAGATSRVLLGTTVLVLPYRPPVLNAKMLGTLQVLSGGRLVLGVGAGWMAEEAMALDMPWDDRGRRTDEHIQVLRVLWGQEDPRFEGRYYRVAGVRCEPRPSVMPPIWVGGHGMASLRRAARLGDGWHAVGLPPDELAESWRRVQDMARECGRDPAALVLSVRCLLRFRDEPRPDDRPLAGTPEQIVRWLEEYRRIGVGHVLLEPPLRPGPEVALSVLERFAREVRGRLA
jgi:probable F420-dependent oxidoreductase